MTELKEQYEQELSERFDWEGLKQDIVQNAIETLHEYTLDELRLHDLTDGEAIVGQAYIGTVFELTPSGKYYMPFACSNVEACPECDGSGEIDNPNHDHIRHTFHQSTAHNMRTNLFREYGAHCNKGWPKGASDLLRAEDGLVGYFAPTLTCEECGGLGSAEAYQDQEWYEALESVTGDHGMWYTAGEGSATDIMVGAWVSFAEIVRYVLDEHVKLIQAWLDGQAAIRDVKEGQRVAKSLINKMNQLERGE